MPIELGRRFAPSSTSGNADSGGWEMTGVFINDQEEAVYGRRATLNYLGEGDGIWDDDYRVAITGSMVPQSVAFDKGQSQTNLTVVTSNTLLAQAGLQGIYFSVVGSPTNVHQRTSWNLGEIVEHLIEGHTNLADTVPGGIVDISGIDTTDSTSINVFTVRQSNSIWSTIQSIAQNEFYVAYFTKNDAFMYVKHPQFIAVLPDPLITFDNTNIIGQPEVRFRNEVRIDQVQLYGLTDDGDIFTSLYPASIGSEVKREKYTSIRVNSQARLDLLAQRAYKFLNRQFIVRVNLAGAWGLLFELYDRVQMTYAGTDRNGVTVNFNQKKFWISSISVSPTSRFGATSSIEMEEEVT